MRLAMKKGKGKEETTRAPEIIKRSEGVKFNKDLERNTEESLSLTIGEKEFNIKEKARKKKNIKKRDWFSTGGKEDTTGKKGK